MVIAAKPSVRTLELVLHDREVSTSPPSIVVSQYRAHDGAMELRFRHKGRGLAITEAASGIVVAWSLPRHAHVHTILHRGRAWHVAVSRSSWRSPRPFRRGLVSCVGVGAAWIEASHLHYVSDWREHRRLHRAWITGAIRLDGDVPGPVLALAVRLILGAEWFDRPTGDWTETRRAWDFAGF